MNGHPQLAGSSKLTERTITTVDGVRLAVRDLHPRHPKTTVVLLHGLCLSQAYWSLQVGYLTQRWGQRIRIVTYDHRGHGSSTCAPVSTYTIDQLADDLECVITALDVQTPLTLVAHSMGGMAALAYLCRPASQRPIDPSGLVLIATAARKLSQRGLGRLLSTPTTAALAHVAAHTPEHILRKLVIPLCVTLAPIRDRLPAATIAATALTALTTTATSTAIGYLPSLRTYDLYPTLPAIRARTVIVSGGVDPLTPPQHAHELTSAIPDAVHVHVPTAGHMLPQQAPNVVNHAIEQAAGLAPKPKNASRARISRPTTRPNPQGVASHQQPLCAQLPGVG
jgi:pimeloyl-ACP methyl ester carboxylesterase